MAVQSPQLTASSLSSFSSSRDKASRATSLIRSHFTLISGVVYTYFARFKISTTVQTHKIYLHAATCLSTSSAPGASSTRPWRPTIFPGATGFVVSALAVQDNRSTSPTGTVSDRTKRIDCVCRIVVCRFCPSCVSE